MARLLPEHARGFRGRAKNIPEKDMFLLPYQTKWVLDESILKLMEKSRRVGISYGTAYAKTRRHSKRNHVTDTWISSRDEPSARLFKRDCSTFAQTLAIGARDLGQQVLDEAGNKAQVLEFANGTAINCLSSNPDAFAGKGGDVVLDEGALRKCLKMVWDVASPSIDWGGMMELISTHRGSGNYFNTLIREIKEMGNPKGISLHRVSLEDALDQHFLWKLQTKLREGDPRLEMDEGDYFNYQKSRSSDLEAFLQEYMCVPGDDAGAFIEYALIDGCAYPEGEKWEWTLRDAEESKNPVFGGIDIGRVNDLTSFILLEKVAGRYLLRKRIDLQGVSFSEQEAQLYPWVEWCGRVCVDKTGLGMQFAERMEERFGKYKVEGVSFTSGMKEELAYPVRSAFEDRGISIPFGDKELERDLRAIKKETTAAGNIRFSADRGEDGHADRFWALALAIHAGKKVKAPPEFMALGSDEASRGGGMKLAG